MAFDGALFTLGFTTGTAQVFGMPTRVTITGTPVTDATVGEAYAGFSVTGHNGKTPYVYSVAADPDGLFATGLTLNSVTGAVAGTPTTAGVYTGIVLRVTDDNIFNADLAPFTLTPVDSGGGGGAPDGFDLLLGADDAQLLGADDAPLYGVTP